MTAVAIKSRALAGIPSRALAIVAVLSLATGVALASGGSQPQPRVGVIVDASAGFDGAAVAAARADVARLRHRGVLAELRVTRTPTESLTAAATLVTRGADTLIVRAVGARVLAPLRDSHPGLRVVAR